MRVSIEDLKNSDFWEYLPKTELKNLSEREYLTFHYWYEDKMSIITDIKNVKVEPKITLYLHKNAPLYSSGEPYSLGYFQPPFDTQNTLFYQFLRYYYVTQGLLENKPKLLEYFKDAKLKDLESIDFKRKNTNYGNVFKINTRTDFKNAIDRFIFSSEQAKDELISIVDVVDAYTEDLHNMEIEIGEKPSFKKTIYGEVINKIVLAIKNPNGGFIPETTNKLRYLYVGENSQILKSDPFLVEAKNMVREKFGYNEIFAKTGWYYNKLDNKWRKPISDAECKLEKLADNSIFISQTSRFKDIDEYYKIVSGMSSSGIKKLVEVGWDTYLSDVLKHDTLYKHYPELFNIPIFLCYKNTTDYSFYYNPESKHIMMFGDPKRHDIKTVLLHETQHAIQRIENYGTGGNELFAKIISSIGGEGVKAYMNGYKIIKQLFISNCIPGGKYSYDRFIAHSSISAILSMDKITLEEYYQKAKNTIELIISVLIYYPNHAIRIRTFVEKDILDQIDIIKHSIESSKKAASNLTAQGFSDRMISTILFNAYESLLGEIESRSVQKMSQIDEELRGYLTPYSVESIEESQITVLTEDLYTDEDIPKRIKAAIEKDDEQRYIIHLTESPECEPFLHELGHIVYDLLGGVESNQAINQNFSEEEIKEMGGVQEIFCELFLNYILRTDVFKELNYEISENRKLKNIKIDFFERTFKDMFFSKPKNEIEFTNRLKYVNELEKLILNNV